jgi:hypothetical protein
MEWKDLEEKQAKEWREFEKLKTASWQRMNEIHTEIKHAFGNDESRIPGSVKEKIDKDKQRWSKQWGKEGYKRAQLIIRQHREQNRLMVRHARENRIPGRSKNRQQGKDQGDLER